MLLAVAGLPRSTFYYHSQARSAQAKHAPLIAQIQAVYQTHRGCYGYRRITLALRHLGWVVNHKSVLRQMRQLGLHGVVRPKKYRAHLGTISHIAPNHLARDFTAAQPNAKWVTDLTEFQIRGEKLYLSPVMDLYNGEIIAYQMARHPRLELVVSMVKQALRRLGPEDRPLLHSDQGWHYQTPAYQRVLREHHVTQSMSRRANCWDNAAMESFFARLKTECVYPDKFTSLDDLAQRLAQYIHYYNHDRIKLKLNGLSPVQYRAQFTGAG